VSSGRGRRGGGHGQGEARGTVSAAGVFGFRKVDAARGFGEAVAHTGQRHWTG
jgi:hypothetical protein